MPENDIEAADWAEQDLLTRDLAVERLTEAEADIRGRLEALRRSGTPDGETVALLESRLRALVTSRRNLRT